MKLELKHLAPYLPYRLNTKWLLSDVVGLHKAARDEVRDKLLTPKNVDFVLGFCKPILRPLSDLTKLVSISKVDFTPIYHIHKGDCSLLIENFDQFCDNIVRGGITYNTAQKLFEWHFDVFGLISEGLAIDINSLK